MKKQAYLLTWEGFCILGGVSAAMATSYYCGVPHTLSGLTKLLLIPMIGIGTTLALLVAEWLLRVINEDAHETR